jgi:hypothetical protein
LRRWIKGLERKNSGNLDSFVLEDGTTHYFNPSSAEVFLHTCDCIRAGSDGEPFPEPPRTLEALCKARDRGAAVEKVAVGFSLTSLSPFASAASLCQRSGSSP